MIKVTYNHGIHLPKLDLWLDPRFPKRRAFVSHAHFDHVARHEEIIMSPATAALLQRRLPGQRIEHTIPFGQTRKFDHFHATLLPAGHICGSAQIYIESDHGTLLHTGDFKLRPGLAAERTEWRKADVLIMETTFGQPKYIMPPTEQVTADIAAFCRQAHNEGAVAILLAYSLGKAQEVAAAMIHAGLDVLLHEEAWNLTGICRDFLPDYPTNYALYDPACRPREMTDKVLICPPGLVEKPAVKKWRRRIAVITGWAMDSSARFRYKADAAFPLSDHADYPDLLRYVELVQPRVVYTHHGFAVEFAAELRRRGVDAWALGHDNQLELPAITNHAPAQEWTPGSGKP